MDFIKKLVLGKLSLALTFWGCGVLFNLFFILLAYWSFNIPSKELLIFTIIFKWIVASMVLSGIFFILRNGQNTIWGILAFIFMLLNFINSTIFLIGTLKTLITML